MAGVGGSKPRNQFNPSGDADAALAAPGDALHSMDVLGGNVSTGFQPLGGNDLLTAQTANALLQVIAAHDVTSGDAGFNFVRHYSTTAETHADTGAASMPVSAYKAALAVAEIFPGTGNPAVLPDADSRTVDAGIEIRRVEISDKPMTGYLWPVVDELDDSLPLDRNADEEPQVPVDDPVVPPSDSALTTPVVPAGPTLADFGHHVFTDDEADYFLTNSDVSCFGNALDNQLTGNAVGALMAGGEGNDTLNGKAGNDHLVGGAGADIFVFERGTNCDTIGDFQPGIDTIQLLGIYGSFAEVQAHMTVGYANLTANIDLGEGDSVFFWLRGGAPPSADDFLYF